MKTEITLTMIDEKGQRFEHGRMADLTEAHIMAENLGNGGEQVTFEEVEGKAHAHIMEFRNGEHYNDIYLL